jgi:hypothetical protein
MIPDEALPIHQRTLVLVLLAVGPLVLIQKGCVPDREIDPQPALSVATLTEQYVTGSMSYHGVAENMPDGKESESRVCESD